MPYDFDTVLDRRGTFSLKWNVPEGELPLWVADMDFAAAPPIRAAIEARAAHGVFGYTILPDEWYQAYIGWWQRRHGWQLQKDWLLFAAGVVPAIGSIIRRLTAPAEKVLVQAPVYNAFYHSIRSNGREVLEAQLVYDAAAHTYGIDWADLEAKLADPQTALMLLCDPHNPTGNLWDRETLARIGALCAKHHVLVLADEIHCDLTDPGCAYVPFASVDTVCAQNSITCMAPSKAFNIAGLQTSAVSVPDPALRHRVRTALAADGIGSPNVFAVTAAIAAFNEGGPWLDELCAYVAENKRTVADFLQAELPQVGLVPAPATYLAWLDCMALGCTGDVLSAHLRRQAGVFFAAGNSYGAGGEHFLRVNLACPRSILQEALRRFKAGVESLP